MLLKAIFQQPSTSSLLPATVEILPPASDHAAAIERAAEPPPLIRRVDSEGSPPTCLQDSTKPAPSVLVPDHSPSILLSWLIAFTPSGPLTPSLPWGECFRGAVQDSQISPSILDTFDMNSSIPSASMKTASGWMDEVPAI